MVPIPGGTFQMGDLNDSGQSDVNPVHTVTLNAFEMSTYVITQEQYREVIGENPSYFTGDDTLPVEMVNWYEAVNFCNLLSDRLDLDRCYERTWICDFSKNGFRLPTEAEWEYACRAGTTTKFHKGDSESDLAKSGWYEMNSDNKTYPVGQKEPNSFGLYDMHGNVSEWCYDWLVEYTSDIAHNPIGARSGSLRVVRGGGWAANDYWCWSITRGMSKPIYGNSATGFRIVRR